MSFVTEFQPPYFGSGSSQQVYANSAPATQSILYEPVKDFVKGPAGAAVGSLAIFSETSGKRLASTTSPTLSGLTITSLAVDPTPSDFLTWESTTGVIKRSPGGGGGLVSLGVIGNTPVPEGATLIAGQLTLQPADRYNGGVLNTDAQFIGGQKIFMDGILIGSTNNTISGAPDGSITVQSNQYISLTGFALGLNSPTFAEYGLTFFDYPTEPNWTKLAASVASGQNTISLPPITGDMVVTDGAQIIGGSKTFSTNLTLQSTLTMPNNAQILHGGFSNMLSSNAVNNNVACGPFSVAAGTNSASFGPNAGRRNVGSQNTFIGATAGAGLSAGDTGNNNVAVGFKAMELPVNATQNVIIGSNAARSTTGMTTNNTIIGFNACTGATNGRANNIVIGSGAGAALGATSDNNIMIGAVGSAVSDAIVIGSTQTSAMVKGVTNNVGSTAYKMMSVGTAGELACQEEFTSTAAVMTLDSGAITSSLLRGVVQGTAGTMSGVRFIRSGRLVWCSVPSWEVNTDSGNPSVVTIMAAGTIPAAFRPTLFAAGVSVYVYNAGVLTSPNATIRVTTAGALLYEYAGTFTTDYGMINGDFTFSYMI